MSLAIRRLIDKLQDEVGHLKLWEWQEIPEFRLPIEKLRKVMEQTIHELTERAKRFDTPCGHKEPLEEMKVLVAQAKNYAHESEDWAAKAKESAKNAIQEWDKVRYK